MRVQRGFTLLEVLVALVLLGVFAFASYRALNAVLEAERLAVAEMLRWRELARTFSRLESDLADAVLVGGDARGAPSGFRVGGEAPGEVGFALDRLLPEDDPAGLQRVAYRYADGRLVRRLERMAPAGGAAAGEATLLQGLRGFSLRYMDEAGQWQPNWQARTPRALPRALEVTLELAGGEPLRRVFRLR